jgi:hypothetical protein
VVTGATSITSTAFVGDITGDVTGNADTATILATARTIGGTSFNGSANIVPATITVADTTDTSSYVGLWNSATGDLAPKTDAGLTYNAGTGMLTATGLTGPLTGTASTATALASGRTIASTGDVVWTSASFDGSGNVTGTAAIGSGVIVNADVNSSAAIAFSKMADLTASRLLVSDGSGDVSVSAVTSTEAGYLDGVTSAIQTQMDTKSTKAFAIAQAVALG